MIVEYCEHGNLRDFLRRHDSRNEGYERPNSERLIISERTLVSFARQVRKFNFQVTKFTWNWTPLFIYSIRYNFILLN